MSELNPRPSQVIDLDPSIFVVESSTTPLDKQSLLRVQKAVGQHKNEFTYLEIGSYKGGTLLPYLRDPCCKNIVSIDKRPDFQPDERAQNFSYKGITTAGMMADLRRHVDEKEMRKLQTFDADVSQLDKAEILSPVDVMLIDGEHTNVATVSDFLETFPLLVPDAFVVLHDVNLIGDALQIISLILRSRGISHSVTILPDVVGVVALGASVALAEANFCAVAIEEKAFFLKAKQQLREQIAIAVAQQSHIGII